MRDTAGTARDVAFSEETWALLGWGMWVVRASGVPIEVAGLAHRPALGAPGIWVVLGLGERGRGLRLPMLVATWDHVFLSEWPDIAYVAGTLQIANAALCAIVEAGGMGLEVSFLRGDMPTERWGICREDWRAARAGLGA